MNKDGWYRTVITECPLCGKYRQTREFIKNSVKAKPVNYHDRRILLQSYDYCSEGFG